MIEKDDVKGIEEAIKYKLGMYEAILKSQYDMALYGRVSYIDSENMKVVERKRFYNYILDTYKNKSQK